MDISLVLGGGGARCFAHVGVIRALEERDMKPQALATCSTASVIGALYAAGYSAARILDLAKEIDFSSFVVLDPGGSGLVSNEKIVDFLCEHAPATFEELHMPLAVVTTDIQTGESLTFRSGELAPVVCASNALPGVFEPVHHAGRYLLDGGILDIVPVDVVCKVTRTTVIAVDVSQSPKRKLELEDEPLWRRLTPSGGTPRALEILKKAYVLRENILRDARYKENPPDIDIRPDLPEDLSEQDFGRIEEAADIGYASAVEALDEQSS